MKYELGLLALAYSLPLLIFVIGLASGTFVLPPDDADLLGGQYNNGASIWLVATIVYVGAVSILLPWKPKEGQGPKK